MKACKVHSPFKRNAWLVISLMSMLLSACGGGGGGGGGGGSAGIGTLGVGLTDDPACGFDAVNVTVVKVRVHQSDSASDVDSGWQDITLSPPQKINLLNLNNGILSNLGQTSLPSGHYTQLRLVLDPNRGAGFSKSVIPTGGVETPLVTPSAVQSGIKLINEFDVPNGQRVDLVLDFDACKSIVLRSDGTYALKPVIKVVPTAINGVQGFVDVTLLNSNVLVTAQQNGKIVQTTAPNAVSGQFLLARLPTGNYDVVLTANAHATAVIAAVPVPTSSSIVNVSNSASPLTLPPSTTHVVSGTAVLNPTSTTVTAYVAAKQTFGVAPTVTVKLTAADDTSVPPGAYSLTLPIAAPLLGTYSATLPIPLVAQGSIAGKYSAEASAEGYTTQSTSADISPGDTTKTFALIP